MQAKQTLWQRFKSPQPSANHIFTNSIRNHLVHSIPSPKPRHHTPSSPFHISNRHSISSTQLSRRPQHFLSTTTSHLFPCLRPRVNKRENLVSCHLVIIDQEELSTSYNFFFLFCPRAEGRDQETIAPFPLLAVAISNSNQPKSTPPQHHSSRNSGTRTNQPALEAERKERKILDFPVWA